MILQDFENMVFGTVKYVSGNFRKTLTVKKELSNGKSFKICAKELSKKKEIFANIYLKMPL